MAARVTFVGILLALPFIILALWLDLPGVFILPAVLLALPLWGLVYRPLRQWSDERAPAARRQSASLLREYAARLTVCEDRASLEQLICSEVLPSLQVRQSALLYGRDEPRVVLAFGVEAPVLTGRLDENSDWPDWVRLVLPLRLGDETAGVWLFGKRDPDDEYHPDERPLFKALADQTALALSYVLQTERLAKLYRANIDRHEQERTHLARALHDDVLNRLAALSLYIDEQSPEVEAAYQKLVASLRRTISDLRPPMLNYGLRLALEELVDDVAGRPGVPAAVHLDVTGEDRELAQPTAQHLYRIVQQAVENAVEHARASEIRIEGTIAPGHVYLVVSDNGVGLDLSAVTVSQLLARAHFGLVNMVERAALINARLKIETEPGPGTRIVLTYPDS